MKNWPAISFAKWAYFACAVIYLVSGLRSGVWLGTTGSLLFLAATVAFLIPIYRKSLKRPNAENNQ